MKRITIGAIALLLLTVSMAVVYAHGSAQEGVTGPVDEMDEMHELMTRNLSPELKEQMDDLHEGCMGYLENASIDNTHGASMMGLYRR